MSSIDEKKSTTDDALKLSTEKIAPFITDMITIVIKAIILFVIGCALLYISKISQTGFFPTDVLCTPYTDDVPVFDPVEPPQININITTNDDGEKISQKIIFENIASNLVGILKPSSETSTQTSFGKYTNKVFGGTCLFTYQMFQKVFTFMNYIPVESAVLLIMPYLFVYIALPMIFVVTIIFLFNWFGNLSLLFIINKNKDIDSEADWVEITGDDDESTSCYLFYFFVGFMGFILLSVFPLLFFLGLFIFFYCLISLLYVTGKKQVNGEFKTQYGFTSFISDNFKYHKDGLLFLIAFFQLLESKNVLGTPGVIFSILSVIILYFFKFPVDVFKGLKPDTDLSALAKNPIVTKTCGKHATIPAGEIDNANMTGGGSGGGMSKIKSMFQSLKKLKKQISK